MKRTILYCIVSSVVLFIFSFYSGGTILEFFLSFFKGSNLEFAVYHHNSPFVQVLKLSASVAAIPMLLLGVWIRNNITSFRERSLTVLIILVCVILGIIANIYRISSHEIVRSPLNIQIPFPTEKLYFEYAILISIFSGLIISYFIFRKKKLQEEMKTAIDAIGA